jgi:hypothetical protein
MNTAILSVKGQIVIPKHVRQAAQDRLVMNLLLATLMEKFGCGR